MRDIIQRIPDDVKTMRALNHLEFVVGLAKLKLVGLGYSLLSNLLMAAQDVLNKHRSCAYRRPEDCPGITDEPVAEFIRRIDSMIAGEAMFDLGACKYGYYTGALRQLGHLDSALAFALSMLEREPGAPGTGSSCTVEYYTPSEAEQGILHKVELHLEMPGMTPEFDRMPELVRHMLLYLERTQRLHNQMLAEFHVVEATACMSSVKFAFHMWVPQKCLSAMAEIMRPRTNLQIDQRQGFSALMQRLKGRCLIAEGQEPPYVCLTDKTVRIYASHAPATKCPLCRRLKAVMLEMHRLLCQRCVRTMCSSDHWTVLDKPCNRPEDEGAYDEPLWFQEGTNTILRMSYLEGWLKYSVCLKERYMRLVVRNGLNGWAACYGYGSPEEFPALHSEAAEERWKRGMVDVSNKIGKIIRAHAHARLDAELKRLPFTDAFRAEIVCYAALGANLTASGLSGDLFIKREDARNRMSLVDGAGYIVHSADIDEYPKNFEQVVYNLKLAAQERHLESTRTYKDKCRDAHDAMRFIEATMQKFGFSQIASPPDAVAASETAEAELIRQDEDARKPLKKRRLIEASSTPTTTTTAATRLFL
ncbi:protein ORF22 [Cyprinid herpesvirus 3]|nr:unnamed protein product [Cyprinid herpesvirus 3]ABC55096.1 hypothetical protein [Cyprinid herpesvirus 3]ABG42853.1 protein ORF22 [Cyprinid herpesvirus 3]AIC32377.1 ORF22R [Cyprinid herpesvirus 3]AJP55516.1 protein ORF22 [Cyprinid herpesvirus 3]AJP55673.1 protein ORF22 [Cyprinid herpesvirus 3]